MKTANIKQKKRQILTYIFCQFFESCNAVLFNFKPDDAKHRSKPSARLENIEREDLGSQSQSIKTNFHLQQKYYLERKFFL